MCESSTTSNGSTSTDAAYLFLADGTFVNLEIIRQGYGHAYLTYPFIYAEDFRAAEREARESNRGLWGEPQQTQTVASGPVRVWVNTPYRVYHCPGTRYYGKTARGEYLAEGDAQTRGHRPAGGKTCGPIGVPRLAQTTTVPPQSRAAIERSRATTTGTGGANVRVWVNTGSGVYHCPGTRYYGSTKNGRYMSQQDADASGHRPAAGRRCG